MAKRIPAFILLAVLLAALAACAGEAELSGTYTDESGMVSYTFNDDGTASVTNGDTVTEIGTFELRDGDVYINGVNRGSVKGRTATLFGHKFTKE